MRLLLTGDVASEGVNLHRECHHMVHFDLPWSLIRIEQRNGRIDRYGQEHAPQFRALILTSAVPGALDDRSVAEKLLAKEEAAHRSLGTAEAVSGLYDDKAEEDRLTRDLVQGRDVDESIEASSACAGSTLADLLAAVGEVPATAEVATVALPRLFESTERFVDEALRELYGQHGDPIDLTREGGAAGLRRAQGSGTAPARSAPLLPRRPSYRRSAAVEADLRPPAGPAQA